MTSIGSIGVYLVGSTIDLIKAMGTQDIGITKEYEYVTKVKLGPGGLVITIGI